MKNESKNMNMRYKLNDIQEIQLQLPKNGIIFIYGDLWAGKTTFVQSILKNQLWVTASVTSPTYTYYNKYRENIYHFDLYRLENYDQFFAIWWEEVIDGDTINFIEWPEILENYYKADIIIHIKKSEKEDERQIDIQYKDAWKFPKK